MAIVVVCPCGRQLRVKDALAGARGKCPACGAALTVPRPGPDCQAPLEPEEPRCDEGGSSPDDGAAKKKRPKGRKEKLRGRLENLSFVLHLAVLLLGCAGLVGWLVDVPGHVKSRLRLQQAKEYLQYRTFRVNFESPPRWESFERPFFVVDLRRRKHDWFYERLNDVDRVEEANTVVFLDNEAIVSAQPMETVYLRDKTVVGKGGTSNDLTRHEFVSICYIDRKQPGKRRTRSVPYSKLDKDFAAVATKP